VPKAYKKQMSKRWVACTALDCFLADSQKKIGVKAKLLSKLARHRIAPIRV
jgi:hypothetical protein